MATVAVFPAVNVHIAFAIKQKEKKKRVKKIFVVVVLPSSRELFLPLNDVIRIKVHNIKIENVAYLRLQVETRNQVETIHQN